MEATHASFFSGVGGLDLGLERAGWRTVSFSEIDPYASRVLSERYPGIPNLGDITRMAGPRLERGTDGVAANGAERDEWGAVSAATLWSGGFPCQDLSVAGKRAGFAGARSSLAFAFLDLVERYRPSAFLLENVPGLLSSHEGKDMARLVWEMGELGYWWAYRVLDAQHFGVPQRRRRVFILALDARRHPDPDSPGAILAVGHRCERHPATGHKARAHAAAGTGGRTGIAGSLTRRYGKGINSTLDDGAIVFGAAPDPGGMRAPDGLAGRLDDRQELASPLLSGQGGQRSTDPNTPLVFRKSTKAHNADDWERWEPAVRTDTLDAEAMGAVQSTAIVGTLRVGAQRPQDGGPGDTVPITVGMAGADDPLLPLGLDSHRYRCCGNGVVASVPEWIGLRLWEAIETRVAA